MPGPTTAWVELSCRSQSAFRLPTISHVCLTGSLPTEFRTESPTVGGLAGFRPEFGQLRRWLDQGPRGPTDGLDRRRPVRAKALGTVQSDPGGGKGPGGQGPLCSGLGHGPGPTHLWYLAAAGFVGQPISRSRSHPSLVMLDSMRRCAQRQGKQWVCASMRMCTLTHTGLTLEP